AVVPDCEGRARGARGEAPPCRVKAQRILEEVRVGAARLQRRPLTPVPQIGRRREVRLEQVRDHDGLIERHLEVEGAAELVRPYALIEVGGFVTTPERRRQKTCHPYASVEHGPRDCK